MEIILLRACLLTTQPSIPPGSVNEDHLWLGKKRLHFVSWCTRGVQVKLRSLENAYHTWAP